MEMPHLAHEALQVPEWELGVILCKDGPLFNAPTFLTPMARATSSGEDSVQSRLGYSEHILFAEVLCIMSQTQ